MNRRGARIGVADTTFARIDMGGAAEAAIREYAGRHGVDIEVIRRTVPGFKDLPVCCKRLIARDACDIVVACGQAGPAAIDRQCAHEATLGLQAAQLLTDTHILEVFVFTDEVPPDQPGRLRFIAENRAREHALNACWLLFEPERLAKLAGSGQRQGFPDEGPIDDEAVPP